MSITNRTAHDATDGSISTKTRRWPIPMLQPGKTFNMDFASSIGAYAEDDITIAFTINGRTVKRHVGLLTLGERIAAYLEATAEGFDIRLDGE